MWTTTCHFLIANSIVIDLKSIVILVERITRPYLA